MNKEKNIKRLAPVAACLYALILAVKPLVFYSRVDWTPFMLSGLIESLVPCLFCILLTLIARKIPVFGGVLFLSAGLYEAIETCLGSTPALLLESLPFLFIGFLFIVTRNHETCPEN